MTKPSIDQNRKTITTLWANCTHDAYTIHELTSISLSTIYNYIKNGESLEHKPRSGRPRKLQRRHLGQLVTSNKYSTSTKLANILNKHHPDLNVSSRTMLNELHDLHYHCTVPKTIPLLTDRHKECERMPFGVCCEIQKTKLEQNYFMANLRTRVEKQVNEMLVKKQNVTVEVFRGV